MWLCFFLVLQELMLQNQPYFMDLFLMDGYDKDVLK